MAPALPIKYSSIVPRYLPAPLIGDHNQYVLGDILGLGDEEIQRLMDEQVVL